MLFWIQLLFLSEVEKTKRACLLVVVSIRVTVEYQCPKITHTSSFSKITFSFGSTKWDWFAYSDNINDVIARLVQLLLVAKVSGMEGLASRNKREKEENLQN